MKDMQSVGDDHFAVDVGYGNIQVVNYQVADYIYMLRRSLIKAGISLPYKRFEVNVTKDCLGEKKDV